MNSFCKRFDAIASFPALLAAAQRAARGKRGKPGAAAFLANKERHLLRIADALQADISFVTILFTPAHGIWRRRTAFRLTADAHRAPHADTALLIQFIRNQP